ncbi:MAG: D-aminopeptidase [Alphaproteobacteria bacterium]
MDTDIAKRLDAVLHRIPRAYPGPGGAIAVLRRGEVLARHAWGYANAERRIRFTPRTLFRACSITKQFVCATLLAECPDIEALAPLLRARLPMLAGQLPAIAHLAHNQSGLRDYWALAMLLGAGAEDPFGEREARATIAATRATQFAPGTRYSYCNQNFRLLGDLLEERSGRSLAELMRARVLGPAGMDGAFLAADTSAMPDGTEGYEGSQGLGFRPAVNRILWTGDAGLGASLDDMIAWERHVDATRDDDASIYSRLSRPVAFADGAPAAYGFGLDRTPEFGHALTQHGGALRGWRSHRVHCAAERVSVVVLFNHSADAQAAAHEARGAVLGRPKAAPDARLPHPDWQATWREAQTGLCARIEKGPPGELRLRFAAGPERLLLQPDGSARSARTTLRMEGGALRMERHAENLRATLEPVEAARAPASARGAAEIAGRWRCAEIEAELEIEDAGGIAHGACSGPLGRARMELLEQPGEDLWLLPCPRALDVAPPGDWTLALRRDPSGRVAAIDVGCWLARGLSYARD